METSSNEEMIGDQGEKIKECDKPIEEATAGVATESPCVQGSGESVNCSEAVPESSPSSESPETAGISEAVPKEEITFKVMYSKKKYDVTFDLNDTVTSLKKHLETLTAVPESMQKLMFRGKMRDGETLKENGLTAGSKVMLVGSTVSDILTVTQPPSSELKAEAAKQQAAKEPLCQQKPHKTILDKHGKPDDAMPGIKKSKERLPQIPISGMYNKSGGKVRLTFKLEQDELWIGTKERTDKIPINSIKNVVSEALAGHEEYHLMGIQLGPTEASRYWVYWVPAQYVDAIKDTLLGKWQHF